MSMDEQDPSEPSSSLDVVLSVPISSLDLSVRTTNVLKNAGAKCLGDLVSYTEGWLRTLPNCGTKTIKEIRLVLAEHGLVLGTPPDTSWTPPVGFVPLVTPPDVPTRSLGDLDVNERAKLYLRISELDFSPRGANALARAGVEFVGDIAGKTILDFIKLENCGSTTILEIRRKFDELGVPVGIVFSDWDPEEARRIRALQDAEMNRMLAEARNAVVRVPESACLEDELSGVLRALANERDTEVVLKLFGWTGKGRRILESVGQEYGLTRERIRQLAARASRKIRERSIETPWLHKAVDALRAACPATSTTLANLLREAGIAKEDFDPSGVIAACEEFGIDSLVTSAPFGGTRVYDRSDKIDTLAQLRRSSRRLTSARGCVNFEAMCDELAIEPAARGKYRELMSLGGRITWLDEERQWLFAGGLARNRLGNLVAKVLFVSPEVSLSELRRAVARSRRLEVVPPTEILARFVQAAGLATVKDGAATAAQSFADAIEAGSAEATILRVFRENGPVLGWDRLQEFCVTGGMNPITVGIYMSASPIVSRLARGVYALVGEKIAPGTVEEVREKFASSRRSSEFGWSTRGTLWCSVKLTRNILVSGSMPLPAFVSDLVGGDDWKVRFGGAVLDTVLKSKNHFLWSVAKPLAYAGAEPDDICILEFDMQARIVNVSIGGEDLADAWESGDIGLPSAEGSEVEEIEEVEEE
jgi:Bacterial RNA polymerase, alpha chain C terminal domain/Sigma-70, region 4